MKNSVGSKTYCNCTSRTMNTEINLAGKRGQLLICFFSFITMVSGNRGITSEGTCHHIAYKEIDMHAQVSHTCKHKTHTHTCTGTAPCHQIPSGAPHPPFYPAQVPLAAAAAAPARLQFPPHHAPHYSPSRHRPGAAGILGCPASVLAPA
eukprot:1139146-Pelagomonas_calceolata.AAC.7